MRYGGNALGCFILRSLHRKGRCGSFTQNDLSDSISGMFRSLIFLLFLSGCASSTWESSCISAGGHDITKNRLSKSQALADADMGCTINCYGPLCGSKPKSHLICLPTDKENYSVDDGLSISPIDQDDANAIINRLGANAACSLQ